MVCWFAFAGMKKGGGMSYTALDCVGAGKPGATTSYTESNSIEPVEPRRVLYSYYTAGSGGVGPTILETSILLAGEPVTVYANGEKVSMRRHSF